MASLKPPNKPENKVEPVESPVESVVVEPCPVPAEPPKLPVDPITEKILSVLGVAFPGPHEAQASVGVEGLDHVSYKHGGKLKSLRLVPLHGLYVWVLWPTH